MHDQRRNPLLLVADDSPESLQMIFDTLAGAGLETIVANDGETVLELVRHDLPDLILLDMVMPGIDGIETCRRLKADASTRDVPVIFLTAHDDVRYRIQTFHVGGVDYISKPFEEAELLARVRTQLSVRNLTKELREQNALLQENIRERAAAQAAREELTEELLRRTEELREANERLEQELIQREQAEEARSALQAQIISAQRERLLELSTPLIPITDRVMVMPLIGSMDAERAGQATEAALRGVASRGAQIVILDVTGIRSVDASVAAMLVRTSESLRLLGARTMVTGIGPEVARMLVGIDETLGSIVTKATLQDGIAAALDAARFSFSRSSGARGSMAGRRAGRAKLE